MVLVTENIAAEGTLEYKGPNLANPSQLTRIKGIATCLIVCLLLNLCMHGSFNTALPSIVSKPKQMNKAIE